MATLNAGNARIVLASAVSSFAVAANTALEFLMKPCSCVGELLSAENTLPPFRSSVLVAALSRLSTARTESTLVANGYSSAIAWLKSWPRLVMAIPYCCCQTWNAFRVAGSNVDRI